MQVLKGIVYIIKKKIHDFKAKQTKQFSVWVVHKNNSTRKKNPKVFQIECRMRHVNNPTHDTRKCSNFFSSLMKFIIGGAEEKKREAAEKRLTEFNKYNFPISTSRIAK